MTRTNRIKNIIHTGVFQQKKELLIAVFVLLNLSVFPQVIEIKGVEVEIDSVLSGSSSYEITARDNITLSPGFSFTPSQGCSLLTEIDPFYTEPVDTGNITGGPGGDIGELVGDDGVVGAIPGTFAASPSGAATYTIPIECPAGVNGMTPGIALAYNSQAGNGIAGWGWNISGVSAISRVPKTIYYDNEVKEIQWDSTDVFALDGQRLITVNDYTDSIEYRLENDPKPKIMGYDCTGVGPAWFKVWDGKGNLYYYSDKNRMSNETKEIYIDAYCSGNDIHEYFVIKKDIVQAFYLSSQKDISDNFIEYKYDYDSTYTITEFFEYENDTCSSYYYEEITYLNTYKNFRLTEVTYGNSVNTLYTVAFTYSDRDDSIHGYIAGERYFNKKILSDVSVKYGDSNGNEIRKYELNYNYSEYSYLQSVELSGLNEEKYNKTVFEWEENDYSIFKSDNYCSSMPSYHEEWINDGWSLTKKNHYCGDFNGDGIEDFFFTYKYIKGSNDRYGWAVHFNTGESLNLQIKGEGPWPVYNKDFYIVDTDLDGKDEIYFKYIYYIDPNWNVRFRRYEYSPISDTIINNWEKDIYIPFYTLDYNEYELLHLIAADFEGRGYPDYLLLKYENNTYSYENTENFQDGCSSSNFMSPQKYQLLDFNGNGKTDILFLYSDRVRIWEYCKNSGKFVNIYSTTLINKNDITFIGDFNGDGFSDILYRKYSTNEWGIVLSDGINLLTNKLIPPELINTSTYPISKRYCLLDVNHDGKTDIIEMKKESDYGHNKFRVFIQVGNSFQLEVEEMFMFGTLPPTEDDWTLSSIALVNDDVTTDIVAGVYQLFHYSISPGTSFNTVKRIYDGFGNDLEFLFQKNLSLYNHPVNLEVEEGSSSVISIKSFSKTIREVKNSNNDKTLFTFNNPIIHLNGKGFLGFHETETKNIRDSIQVSASTQFSKLVPIDGNSKYMLLPDSIVNKVYLNTVSLRKINYSTKTISNNKYIITDNISSEDNVSNTITKQYFTNYNDHLLPLTTYTRYYQDTDQLIAVDSTVTTYTNIISGDKRIIGLPDSVITFKKRPGETDFTRKTDFEYNINGMLHFKIEEKDSPKELKEEYVYDTYGNTITLKVSAPNESGAPLREQNFTYYANGYHLESKQDALDYEESSTYYTENGLLKTITNEENNLTTEFEYDGFGRQIKVTHPDGNEEYTGLRWATDHPDAPDSSLYYSYQKSSGNPPAFTFYDKFGRELRSVSTGFNGEEIYQDTEYDNRSRIYRQSQPYESSGDKYWTVFQYDTLNRLSREDYPDERFTEYDYDGRTTNITSGRVSDTRQSVQTINGLGEVTISMDNADNTVETTYYSSGLPKEKKVGGSYSTLLSYDIYGNRDTISDPDAGTIASQYNVFGELISQTDALGNKTSYTYDDMGRVLTEKQYAPGDVLKNTKTYGYDTRFTGALSTVTQDSAQHSIEYYYDDNGFGRLVRTVETYDGLTIENKFTHDAYGRLVTREYPSGFKVYNSYNVNGYLKSIKGNNKTLWECLDMNPLGQVNSHKQGSYTSQTGYDAYGELQSQTFANGRGMNYGFDNKGNMSYREDIHKNLKETFGYDELDRLNKIAYYVNGNHQVYLDRHIMYDESGIGNISSITGVGSEFNYGENDAGPHALTSVSRPEPGWRPGPQEIKYTAFNKVSSIVDTAATGKTLSYSIYYGMDDQRRKSVYKDSGQVIRTKYYFGDYERINENSETKNYHYISSPTGLCAIFVTEGSGTQGQVWHTYTDHLGSLIYMVNADNSNDYKEYSYDAWGNPRDAEDWTDTLSEPLFGGRGFTGHEHLEEFALIDMNGRIYDPMLGRFFSPDSYVQLPGYAGSYDRYSYCLNNPLIYTDPDGEFIFSLLASIIPGAQFLLPIAMAMDMSALSGGANATLNGESFWKGATIGALTGGLYLTPSFLIPSGFGSQSGFLRAGFQFISTSLGTGLESYSTSGNFKPNWGIAGLSAIPGLLDGTLNGIDAVKHNGKFWNGSGYTKSFSNNSPLNPDDFMGSAAPIKKESLELSIMKNNYYFNDKEMELIASNFQPNNRLGDWTYIPKSKNIITIYKDAFQKQELLDLVLGHEIMHEKFYRYRSSLIGGPRFYWEGFREHDVIFHWMDIKYVGSWPNRYFSPWRNLIVSYSSIFGAPVKNPYFQVFQ